MQCTGCPYIKEDLDRMIDEYYEYPDSVYSEYEISEFLYKYYWCEKVGGKIYHYGVCSELEHNIKKHKSLSKQKRRNNTNKGFAFVIFFFSQLKGITHGNCPLCPKRKLIYVVTLIEVS